MVRCSHCGWGGRLNRLFAAGSVLHNGITRIAPQGIRVIQHDLDHQRHQLAEDGNAVAQLFTVDLSVPGGAAVDKLVA